MVYFNRLLGFSVALVMAGASSAGAQTVVDMKGGWSGTGSAVVDGPAPHHPATETGKAAGNFRLREVKFTYKIEGQDGSRFWGTITSPFQVERLMGVIAADGKRIYMVAKDGFIDGVFVDADTIDTCYRDIKPASAVVACNLVKRSK